MGKRPRFSVIPIGDTENLLTVEEVAAKCGIHPHLVRQMVLLGVIDPAPGNDDRFSPGVVFRVQRLFRLRQDLSVNFNAAGLILDLLDRLDRTERRLRWYETYWGRRVGR